MGLIQNVFSTSVGRKMVMAFTGLGLCTFLAVHLSGNLILFAGKQPFNAYVDRLHSLGPVRNLIELVLFALGLLHAGTGMLLFIRNITARPLSYHETKPVSYKLFVRKNGKTAGSSTMPYTGIILLSFIIFHLATFKFADHTGRTTFDIVKTAFSVKYYVATYLVSMAVAALHVSHGFWSAFRSFGADEENITPFLKKTALFFSAAVGFGFGSIPLYLFLN